MATVKMQKGDLVSNIDDSPESIAHAKSMGYEPVDEPAEQPRRGRPPKEADPAVVKED